ncbi:MAG: TolC family protein [Candidatus Neomarinimicrobiota bacterium]|nr:TolC family protein [Candidatus Neomarinimicrobiota bacterium]
MFRRIVTFIIFMSACAAQQIFTLDQCIQIALENNLDVRLAQLDVEAAIANRKGSFSVILPRISASTGSGFQGAYTPAGSNMTVDETEYHSGSLSFSQNIFDGGNWWNQLALSKNSLDLAVHGERSTRINSVLLVKRAYYQQLKNIELLEVIRRQVELSERQVERVRKQYELEAVSKSDLLKQEVLLGDARVQYIGQEATLHNSHQILANIMGIDVNSDFELSRPTEDESSTPFQGNEIWNLIEAQNPLLVSKRMQLASQDIRVKIARAGYFPSLSMSIGYSGSSDKFDEVFSNEGNEWRKTINLSLSYPLFSGLQRSSQMQQAQIQARIQRQELTQLSRNLKIQYENTFRVWKNMNESISIFQGTKLAAEEDLKLAQERYALGAATILDLLNAQLSVARANSSLVRARYDERILKAELEALTGTF